MNKPNELEKLIDENQSRLKAFIHKRVSNKEDAEDILQDVFYQLTKTIENTLNPIEQATAWLYRVSQNIIINKSKKMQEEELPAEQREAFELMEMEGIPAKGLSATTGVPVNTLLSRKHYAVVHLRKRLKGLYYDVLNY